MSAIYIKVSPANYIVQVVVMFIHDKNYFVDQCSIVYDIKTKRAIGYLEPRSNHLIIYSTDLGSDDESSEYDSDSEYHLLRVDSQR